MAIRDLSSLRKHLQWAMELEHATIPPYLFALYSIKEGTNAEVREILRSIFMEEMLHMTLAANVLNAVGGTPRLDKPDFIPGYPSYLPHSNRAFLVPLSGFSPATVRTLMRIERPEEAGAPPEDDLYETIGQFYEAIKEGLLYLYQHLGSAAVFSGDPGRQVKTDGAVYAGSGRIIPVTDIDSARAALEEIMHQGEGLNHGAIWDGDRNMFHHERDEVGHYFRLQEILEGRRFQRGDSPQTGPTGPRIPVDWDAVYKPADNPKSANYPPESNIRGKMHKFGREYSEILRLLERGFNGELNYIARSVGAMYELKQGAMELMRLPSGDGANTVGPPFEYHPGEPTDRPEDTPMIEILPDGPYAIQGNIPLVRKRLLRSEAGEALAWRQDGELETLPDYTLCRCGASSFKPFCDGSHATIGFDGTETADTRPSAERQESYAGTNMIMHDDRPLCLHAGFCTNRVTDAWRLMAKTDNIQTRIQVIGMIEHCPSGSLTYTLDDPHAPDPAGASGPGTSVEPTLAQAIAVIPNGPLWVTGGVPMVRSDGIPLEVRNRVALCRCGHSKNKPFCDGTHAAIGFVG
ncbi:MAG: ferritin-like domain-containing protein [Pseudomonadota bacterium]